MTANNAIIILAAEAWELPSHESLITANSFWTNRMKWKNNTNCIFTKVDLWFERDGKKIPNNYQWFLFIFRSVVI